MTVLGSERPVSFARATELSIATSIGQLIVLLISSPSLSQFLFPLLHTPLCLGDMLLFAG